MKSKSAPNPHRPGTAKHDHQRSIDEAAGFLEHFHAHHTEDLITRITGDDADIYVVSDPQWRQLIAAAIRPAFTRSENGATVPPEGFPPVPTPEIIAIANAAIHAMGEAFEPFRKATGDAFHASGVRDEGITQIASWIAEQVQSGKSMPEAGINALGGAILSGFQLGLITAQKAAQSTEKGTIQ